MDGRGISLFALVCAVVIGGCIPKQLTVPMNDQKATNLDEKPDAPEPTSLNPFAAKPKREPKFEASLAFYCEEKAKRLKDKPEQQNRELDEARRIYQEILNYDNTYLNAYRGLGRVYVALRDLDRAVTTYRKAMELHPKNASLYDDLSAVYSMKGDYATAIQCLNKALGMEPENRDFMFRLAINMVQAGQIDQGADMMARARGRAAGHYFLARHFALMNRPDEARRQAQFALETNPNYNDARVFLNDLDRGRMPTNPIDPNPVVNVSAPPVGLQFNE